MQHDMKSINLFGQEEHVFTNRGKSQKGLFDDYEGFVEKFKPKKIDRRLLYAPSGV
mgnify:CR=1 FL=1